MKEQRVPLELTHAQAMELLSSAGGAGFRPLGAFYTCETNGRFTAIDNTTGDAWTEEFESLADCLRFLGGEEPEQQKTAAPAGNRRSGHRKINRFYCIMPGRRCQAAEKGEETVRNRYAVPDHPAIAACERTGYPPGREPGDCTCPVCGEECETIYMTIGRMPVGCDVCLETCDAYEYHEEESQ